MVPIDVDDAFALIRQLRRHIGPGRTSLQTEKLYNVYVFCIMINIVFPDSCQYTSLLHLYHHGLTCAHAVQHLHILRVRW